MYTLMIHMHGFWYMMYKISCAWMHAIGAPYKAPGPREFASGDYVKVELDEDAFSAAMQSGNSLDIIMVMVEDILSCQVIRSCMKIKL